MASKSKLMRVDSKLADWIVDVANKNQASIRKASEEISKLRPKMSGKKINLELRF